MPTSTPHRERSPAASTTPSSIPSKPKRVSAAQRRTVTVARNALFRLDQIAQKREHVRVGKVCSIRAHRVWRLARALGISLPPSQVRAHEAPRNICHALGSALSSLFTHGHGPAPRQRTYAYPIRVLGAGIAGVAFCMSDGTVIKAVALRALRGEAVPRAKGAGSARAAKHLAQTAPARARSAGLASHGRAVPLREFLYETRITRRAQDTFDSSRPGRFRVPRVLRHVILEGKQRHGRAGGLIGVMQLSWAPGTTLHQAIRSSPPALGAALARRHGRALAAIHEKGWVHGDMHSSNVIVDLAEAAGKSAKKRVDAADAATFTVIDWARANTLRSLLRNHPAGEDAARRLHRKILRYEVAHPYRDYMRSASRDIAEAYLAGYLERSGAGTGKGVFGGAEPLVEIRALRKEWGAIFDLNVGAMFRALDISTQALHQRRHRIHHAASSRGGGSAAR